MNTEKDPLAHLAGRYKSFLAILPMLIFAGITSGLIALADGVNPNVALTELLAMVFFLLGSDHIDTKLFLNQFVDTVASYDFKDDRIDDAADILQGAMPAIEVNVNPPADAKG